jgi:Gpi18-like mannosyltransferase
VVLTRILGMPQSCHKHTTVAMVFANPLAVVPFPHDEWSAPRPAMCLIDDVGVLRDVFVP